jgi:hypothetical protein
MADAARKRATYEDVLKVPDHMIAEIVDGELITSPRPAPRYARAASQLGAALMGPFDGGIGGPGGWWILHEPELHLLGRREPLVPDLAGWRVERMPDLPETAWFEVTPDWICEVLSPSTAALDRADKMPIYAQAGVAFAWLVDPVVQTIEIYQLESARWMLLETVKGDRSVQLPPFEAVPLELAPLWRIRTSA